MGGERWVATASATMIKRCPFAEWVPWKPVSAQGQPTYYADQNAPEAVVLHVMQGYVSTARQWALSGHYGASWHFTIGFNGEILQHLEPQDGGFHAGITAEQALAHPPTWPLWKGHLINVNHYTIGIEHEGFYDGFPWRREQAEASKRLCHWISDEWGISYNRLHFPAHAEIDVVNRVNDFARPSDRELHYEYLFGEEPMTPEERARLERLERIVAANGWNNLTGEAALAELDRLGASAFLSVENLNKALTEHTASGNWSLEQIEAIAVDAVADKLVGN